MGGDGRCGDDVQDGRYEEIGKLVVNQGYKSHYEAWSFDGIVTDRRGRVSE